MCVWFPQGSCVLSACRLSGRHTAASVARNSSRNHSVRTYSLLGGLFGNKGSMGSGGSKAQEAPGAREGWTPAAGEALRQHVGGIGVVWGVETSAGCCHVPCAATTTTRKILQDMLEKHIAHHGTSAVCVTLQQQGSTEPILVWPSQCKTVNHPEET